MKHETKKREPYLELVRQRERKGGYLQMKQTNEILTRVWCTEVWCTVTKRDKLSWKACSKKEVENR